MRVLVFGLIIFCIQITQLPAIDLPAAYMEVKYLHPSENEIVFYKNVRLEWSPLEKSEKYVIQISNTKGFENVAMEISSDTPTLSLPLLGPYLEYYWRVKPTGVAYYNVPFSGYSFFTTSKVEITKQGIDDEIQIFPTQIENQEILVFDNPQKLTYDIEIMDEATVEKSYQRISEERKGINVSKWRKRRYQIHIIHSGQILLSKQITLN